MIKHKAVVFIIKIIYRFILSLSACATCNNSVRTLQKLHLFKFHILSIACLLENYSTLCSIKASLIDVNVTWQLKITLVEKHKF